MAGEFLDDAARTELARAVEAIEGTSAVEVVVAIRRRSAAYRHANVLVGALAAFAGLAIVLFAEDEFGLYSILVDPFVVGLLAGALVELLPGLKRALTPAATRARAVDRAAKATFVERGVHNTTGRSGLLVYCSWLERQVALVADSGLAQSLPKGALAVAEQQLTNAMRTSGAEVGRTLAALAPQLGLAMPHRDDDVNELPDAIDSDLPSRGKR